MDTGIDLRGFVETLPYNGLEGQEFWIYPTAKALYSIIKSRGGYYTKAVSHGITIYGNDWARGGGTGFETLQEAIEALSNFKEEIE